MTAAQHDADRPFVSRELCEEKSLLLYLQKERNARLAEYNTHCWAAQACRAWCVFCNSGGDNHPLPLARISLETARGMGYLTSLGYVHRDLAARNVLVTRRAQAHDPDLAYTSTGTAPRPKASAGVVVVGGGGGHGARDGSRRLGSEGAPGITCKIADFGLARQLSDGKGYYRSRAGLVALRWAAPESVLDQRFSTKSDIWAYGVLLAEVHSLGAPLFPVGWNDARILMEVCERGYRIPRPALMPARLYTDIVAQCWHVHPQQRPDFAGIVGSLERMAALPATAAPASGYVTGGKMIPELVDRFLDFAAFAALTECLRGVSTLAIEVGCVGAAGANERNHRGRQTVTRSGTPLPPVSTGTSCPRRGRGRSRTTTTTTTTATAAISRVVDMLRNNSNSGNQYCATTRTGWAQEVGWPPTGNAQYARAGVRVRMRCTANAVVEFRWRATALHLPPPY